MYVIPYPIWEARMKRLASIFLPLMLLALCAACSTQQSSAPQPDSESVSVSAAESVVVSTTESEQPTAPEEMPVVFPLPENTAAPLEGYERVYDTYVLEDQCRQVFSILATSAYRDWSAENPDALYSVYFKSYVERMYFWDTGREFEHTDGYTDIENYITYGRKYFNLSEDILRGWLTQDSTYNAENGTILLSDGLGSMVGAHFIAMTPVAENRYIIDFALSGPDDSFRLTYAKIAFEINPDGSFRFLSNTCTGEIFTPAYSHDRFGGAQATSEDGTLELVYGESIAYSPLYRLQEVFVRNTADYSQSRSLGFFVDNTVSDVGFFSNGDIYVMDVSGLTVYSADVQPAGPIFTTKTNFPAGGVFGTGSEERYLYAIRRNPEKLDYIVVYSQNDFHQSINRFQLNATYRVGILNPQGFLAASWDTGVPVMGTVTRPEDVQIIKTGDNEIQLIVPYFNGEGRLQGSFDLTKGVYTAIGSFQMPADEELAYVKQLANEQVDRISMLLTKSWDTNTAVSDFSFIAVLCNLYRQENHRYPYCLTLPVDANYITEVYRTGDLRPVAQKYFGFTDAALDVAFYQEEPLDDRQDVVMLGDGWGWMRRSNITDVVRSGENYVIHYQLLTPDDQVSQTGILTARLNGDTLQFLSNAPQ